MECYAEIVDIQEMTDYSTMTDQELDKLAAEMLGIVIDKDGYWILKGQSRGLWIPCFPSSNQAERYLFTKLTEAHMTIHCYSLSSNYHMTEIRGMGFALHQDCSEAGQINRTKVVAFLEVWSKLNG